MISGYWKSCDRGGRKGLFGLLTFALAQLPVPVMAVFQFSVFHFLNEQKNEVLFLNCSLQCCSSETTKITWKKTGGKWKTRIFFFFIEMGVSKSYWTNSTHLRTTSPQNS